MLKFDLQKSVFVFDLDDTLYYEADYVRSGIRFVVEYLDRTLGRSLSNKLLNELFGNKHEIPPTDWLQKVAEAYEVKHSIESLLWIYRLHPPTISLDPETSLFVISIAGNAPTYILTDGRQITQKLKLNALGLGQIPCLISEQFDSEKPNELRFRLIMEKHTDRTNCIYIGDNLNKDFLAPNRLNWATVGIRHNPRMIHRPKPDLKLTSDHHPKLWISSIAEMKALV